MKKILIILAMLIAVLMQAVSCAQSLYTEQNNSCLNYYTFENSSMNLSFDLNEGWTRSDAVPHTGRKSFISNLSARGMSRLSLKVAGQKDISFWWRSSGGDNSKLLFRIDNSPYFQEYTGTGWKKVEDSTHGETHNTLNWIFYAGSNSTSAIIDDLCIKDKSCDSECAEGSSLSILPQPESQFEALANITPSNITPSNITPSNITPSNITPSNITPSNITPSNITPSNITPSNITPSNITPSNITPSNITPSNITPSNITPSNITPSNITPSNITPSNITPSNITPSNITPSNITPSNITPSNITPLQYYVINNCSLPPAIFPSIQEAINMAPPGSTINIIGNGIEYAGGLIANKSINLVGNNAIIRTNNEDIGCSIVSNNVSINHIRFVGGKSSIYIYNAAGCNISDNIFERNRVGILLWYVENSKLFNNNLSEFSMDAIRAVLSSGNTIRNNRLIRANEYGINLDRSDFNTIAENIFRDTYEDGIFLNESDENSIFENTFAGRRDCDIYSYNSLNETIDIRGINRDCDDDPSSDCMCYRT